MDLQNLLFISIALFTFSAFICNKVPTACVVFALTSFLIIGTMAVLETANRINMDFQQTDLETKANDKLESEQSYFRATINPKYGNENEEKREPNNINGRVIEVEPIRCEAYESDLSFMGLIPCLI